MKDLGTRSVTAVMWGGGGAALRILLQLVTQIALARILGPAQYGLFAIGAIVISFSNFFSDIGIAYGLIQKQEVTDRDVRFVFTWQMILGSAVTLAIAFFSGGIAAFLGDNSARDVVLALAVVCLLNALAAPSNNLLKRALNFKTMQIAQLSGYVVGYIFVGLPLAVLGAEVWALVAAWLVQSVVVLGVLYANTRHSVRPLVWYPDAQKLSQYGGTVLITNVTNWFIGNIDRVIIARYFSSKEVGLYATSYNVLQNPTSALLGVVQPVFFASSSRITSEQTKIISAYYALISAIALFVLPVFACVSAVAETVVLAMYGSQWIDAAEVFRPLALAMPLFLIWGMTTPVLWTGGKPSTEFRAQLPIAILWVLVSWAAAQHSMMMVGWAVCGMFALRCVVVVFSVSKSLNLTWARIWAVCRGGLFVSAVSAAAAMSTDLLLNYSYSLHPFAQLSLVGTAGALVYFALLLSVRRLITPELANVIDHVAGRCPPKLAKLLRSKINKGGPHVSR